MKTYFKAAKLMTEKADAEEALEDVMEVISLNLTISSQQVVCIFFLIHCWALDWKSGNAQFLRIAEFF